MDRKKVLLGMSGGIDSSMSAMLLKEKGYEVIGITFKVFSCDLIDRSEISESSCCSADGIEDAVRVARFLKIAHYTIDVSVEFDKSVIKYFTDEYLAGNTPNPCVKCNKEIKWEKLLKLAGELGSDYIASGHYARIKYDENNGRYILSKAKDANKDQSYALWTLSQEQLSRTIFPLGDYTKTEIRKIASSIDLPVAKKQESFEICFIPDDDYGKFLLKYSGDSIKKIGEGDIIFNGKVIGRHKGYPFYTIGQRRGLGLALKTPVYVKRIFPQKNIIEIGTKEEILSSYLMADSINLIKYPNILNMLEGKAKIRYKDPGSDAKILQIKDRLEVNFITPKSAITPGQSLVFYEGDDVVAGGIIREFK